LPLPIAKRQGKTVERHEHQDGGAVEE